MHRKFLDLIKRHESILEEKMKKYTAIGYIKLLLAAVLLVILFFIFYKGAALWETTTGALLLVGFIVLTVYNGNIRKEINYQKGMIEINKRYLARIDGTWTEFSDFGQEFCDSEHNYAADLDVVGRKSVFQMLNVANTWHGRRIFAKDLMNPEYSGDEIGQRQQAVRELAGDIQYASHMQFCFSKIDSGDGVCNLISQLNNKDRFLSVVLKNIFLIVPPITLAILVVAFAFDVSLLYKFGGVMVLGQAITWLAMLTQTLGYLGAIKDMPYKLVNYSDVIENIQNKKFESEMLNKIRDDLSAGNQLSAVRAIKDLGTISAMLSARSNGILNVLFNVFLLWDIRCSAMLEGWKLKYASLSEEWFISLGNFESLMSMSVLPNVCNNVCLPTISAERKTLRAAELGHPLISNETRVCNDIMLDNGIIIISGSNMSGKTTFLRTVGVNLVLARAGAYVCAHEMYFSQMKPVTSMRIADDLNEGVSTFYAELKRIRKIIEAADSEGDIMFFIDEIFKGTNSKDRLSGARAVISRLNEHRSVGMITTHDLELCEMSLQHSGIKNYSFAEYYKDGRIFFDYKMKSGMSTAANARFLMEMVGIITGD